MIKFDLKNSLENLAIAVVVFITGAYIGHKYTKITSESVVELLKPTIEKAIDKETVSNTINNAINNEFKKIKKSDSLKITINQEPFNDFKPSTKVVSKDECYLSQEDYNALKESERNKLDRQIKRWTKN